MAFNAKCISFKGESHERKGMICQDYSGYICENDYSVALVADGHGSKIRSDIGAKIALESSMAITKELLHDPIDFKERIQNEKQNYISMIKKLYYESWLKSIFDYHVENPLTDTELLTIKMPKTAHEVFSIYGTTLIVAILTKQMFLGLQIGDGACDLVFDDGTIRRISELTDDRCHDDITTSISDPNANERFHHFFIDDQHRIPIAAIVYSDGFDVEEDNDNEKTALEIFSMMGDDSLWFSQICPMVESRSHKYKKDDTSIAMVFDNDTDFIGLYNKIHGKEYPYFDYEPKLPKYAERISTGGTIESDIVNEFLECRIDGTTIQGQFSNDSVQEKVEDQKAHTLWDHYCTLFNNLENKPASSQYIAIRILELTDKIRRDNHYNLSESLRGLQNACRVTETMLNEIGFIPQTEQEIDLHSLRKKIDCSKIESATKDQKTIGKTSTIIIDHDVGYDEQLMKTTVKPEGSGKVWKTIYDGSFKNGQFHGEGTEYLPDGTVYKGSFENGMFKYGFIYKNEVLTYYGPVENNQRNGLGFTFSYSAGRCTAIECNCLNDVMTDGKVTEYYLKNEPKQGKQIIDTLEIGSDCILKMKFNKAFWMKRFVGEYKGGMRNGLGKVIADKSGNDYSKNNEETFEKAFIYEGEFKDNKWTGDGKLYRTDTSVDIDSPLSEQMLYESGYFKNGSLIDGKRYHGSDHCEVIEVKSGSIVKKQETDNGQKTNKDYKSGGDDPDDD